MRGRKKRFLSHITKSIGLMQAVILIFTSVLIGLGLGAVQLKSAYSDLIVSADAQAEDILALTKGGASNAAWTLDRRLATAVVKSVMTISGVLKAEITDEQKMVLARVVKTLETRGWLEDWFVRTLYP